MNFFIFDSNNIEATKIRKLNKDDIYYTLALTLVPGIGPVNARSLISYCGSAAAVFKAAKRKLISIPGVGAATAEAIVGHTAFERAADEMLFIEKHSIECLLYTSPRYPQRLRNCVDAPPLLFFTGTGDLNNEKVIGIVGTRNATGYGKKICEELIENLKEYNFLMVSGLAYGIDIAAHKACVKKDVATVGVVAHGLDRIYPQVHSETARKMQNKGGVLSEFISDTQPDRQNFPKRNRIVAGMVDALIVVETATDGGAIITPALANTYNRDVLAFPGNIESPYSKGCHYLIKTNRAQLVENAADIADIMNWNEKPVKPKLQRQLFLEFSPEEKLIYEALKEKELAIDELSSMVPLSPSTLASNLLNLEFQNIIVSLPGKRYKLN